MSKHLLTTITFASLDMAPELLQGTRDAGFEFCTPIQAAALPHALNGHDVEGQAQTGTGKSAAFLLATMNHLLKNPPRKNHKAGDPRALIFAPTRELAVQIHKDALVLGKHTDLRIGVVFGGTGYEQQREMLHAGLDILIGTPGRAIDYLKQRIYSLNGIQVVVMDEADRMFDLGFIKDIRFVLRRMPPPPERLNMLFSATLSHRVSELAYEHMNSPTVINANPEQVTVSNVSQVLYHVSNDEKIPLLIGILERIEPTRTMVFVNTKRAAEKVEAYLEGNGVHAGLLTGDVPQRKRLALLEKFTSGKLPVLVATDVASRGLHIPDVSHIVNFDLPQDAEDYVHRVGRTARAGASGDAVSFACESYVYSLMDIEAFIGAKIPTAPITEGLLAKPKPPARRERRRGMPPPRSKRGRSRSSARRAHSP